MEKRAVLDGAARFFCAKIRQKEVMAMTYIERLVAAGIRPDCAVETVVWYQTQGDECGLERFVAGVETQQNLEVSQR